MTNNVVITIACGTDNPNRATRAIHLATVAHKEGKKVTLFLLDEAVYLAKKGLLDHLRAATGDVADDLMTYLQANQVPVLACTPCAKARGPYRGRQDGYGGRIDTSCLRRNGNQSVIYPRSIRVYEAVASLRTPQKGRREAVSPPAVSEPPLEINEVVSPPATTLTGFCPLAFWLLIRRPHYQSSVL